MPAKKCWSFIFFIVILNMTNNMYSGHIYLVKIRPASEWQWCITNLSRPTKQVTETAMPPRPTSDWHCHAKACKWLTLPCHQRLQAIDIAMTPKPTSDWHYHATKAYKWLTLPCHQGLQAIDTAMPPGPTRDWHCHATKAQKWLTLQCHQGL